MIVTFDRHLRTRGQGDTHDITETVAAAVTESKLAAGVAVVFVTGSTAAVTTIEFEPGAVADFAALLERLVPRHAPYKHHERWGDDNGSSHVRAALLGPSLSVPFRAGKLTLGTWQQIVLVELDVEPRERAFVIQVMGE